MPQEHTADQADLVAEVRILAIRRIQALAPLAEAPSCAIGSEHCVVAVEGINLVEYMSPSIYYGLFGIETSDQFKRLYLFHYVPFS